VFSSSHVGAERIVAAGCGPARNCTTVGKTSSACLRVSEPRQTCGACLKAHSLIHPPVHLRSDALQQRRILPRNGGLYGETNRHLQNVANHRYLLSSPL